MCGPRSFPVLPGRIAAFMPKDPRIAGGSFLCYDLFMVRLVEIDEGNLNAVLRISVRAEQRRFVPTPAEVLVRAWICRKKGAEALAIVTDGAVIGLLLVYELTEPPACYCLMEMLVDADMQGKGFGQSALHLLIDRYRISPRFPMLELAVDRENALALHVYQRAGFSDSGYTDPDLPQYRNLVYRFSN